MQLPAVAPDEPGITVLKEALSIPKSEILLTNFSPLDGRSKYHPDLLVVSLAEDALPHLNAGTVINLVVVLTLPAASRPLPAMAPSDALDVSSAVELLS